MAEHDPKLVKALALGVAKAVDHAKGCAVVPYQIHAYTPHAEAFLTALRTARPDVAAVLDGRAKALGRNPTIEMEVAGTETWLCIAAMEERCAAIWPSMWDAAPAWEAPHE